MVDKFSSEKTKEEMIGIVCHTFMLKNKQKKNGIEEEMETLGQSSPGKHRSSKTEERPECK